MNDEFSSQPDAVLDRWLLEQHWALVGDVGATLDLEAGLRDALLPGRHARLVKDLGDVLDVQAGLAAIVPTTSVSAIAAETDLSWATDLHELVRAVASSAPRTRLALRTIRTFAILVRAGALASALNRALDLDVALAHQDDFDSCRAVVMVRRLSDDLARSYSALGRGLDLGGDYDVTFVCGAADALLTVLARTPNLHAARERTRALTRQLAIELAWDLSRARGHFTDALYRVLARDCDLARDLAHALDRIQDFALVLGDARVRDLAEAVALARSLDLAEVLAQLYTILNDFTGADLRDAELGGVPIEGLRWSLTTQWPPDWAEQIRRGSVEIFPGIFEVRIGEAHAPSEVSTV